MAEAARYARVAPATLRSWAVGRPYETLKGRLHSAPLIALADPARRLLSFNNLVEAHVLRALRVDGGSGQSGVALRDIRAALDYAERELGIERLLLRNELLTDSRHLFLDHLGQLVNLSRSGQIAMKELLDQHLRLIERDDVGLPLRLHPLGQRRPEAPTIAIDPAIGFGRPIVKRRGIETHTLVERVDSGEDPSDVAADYGLREDEVREAILFERAA
jgi:uncharacterized protein (DUF433 family)